MAKKGSNTKGLFGKGEDKKPSNAEVIDQVLAKAKLKQAKLLVKQHEANKKIKVTISDTNTLEDKSEGLEPDTLENQGQPAEQLTVQVPDIVEDNRGIVSAIQDINNIPSKLADDKEPLTDKELKFIEIYLTSGVGEKFIDNAMISAGYGEYSQGHRYLLAKKILNKYECQAEDHRKIFRAIGAGETAVAQGLLTLATTAKSEAVRLNAWTTIARVMGLTKETVDALQGVNIVIKTGGGAPVKVGIMASSAPKTPPGPVSVIK